MRRLLGISVAIALLAGCGEGAFDSDGELARRSDDNGNEWKRCNYEFQLSPQATHSDLLQVLRANKIQVCKWLGQSRVLGFRPGPGVQCQFNSVEGVDSVKFEATDKSAVTNCATPEIAVPSSKEASALQAFCYRIKIGGRPQKGDTLMGAGSSLFTYLGFPVRFVTSEGAEGKFWADLDAYPWSASFAEDVESATNQIEWDFELTPCK